MMWQVLSCDNLKWASQPTTMWIDHAEQGEEDDQEGWNIDHFGETAKRQRKEEGQRKWKERQGRTRRNMLLL